MINSYSIEATRDLKFGLNGRLVRPAYGSYCFASIPETIRSVFGAQQVGVPLPSECLPAAAPDFDRVLFFFIDGLG